MIPTTLSGVENEKVVAIMFILFVVLFIINSD